MTDYSLIEVEIGEVGEILSDRLPTLRDQFAMAALQGLLASEPNIPAEPAVKAAYEYADEALKEKGYGYRNRASNNWSLVISSCHNAI